jgi:hypothetical protein
LDSGVGIEAAANSKLQLLGWNGVTLDYQSLQLALAWIEILADTKKESPLAF